MRSICCLSLILMLTCFLILIVPSLGLGVYNLQVGAFGDDGSSGNVGVQVEIRTHIYTITKSVIDDSFWVGDNLANGAFIQFGYELQLRGSYCTYLVVVVDHSSCQGASTSVTDGDARWFWEFLPNLNDPSTYSFGMEPLRGSIGIEGSWHTYRIIADRQAGWDLVLDGSVVASVNSPSVKSSQPAYFVAEEVTSVPQASGYLGPVEFRNLAYYKDSAWHGVEGLNAISNCGALNPYCGVSIPYGVSVHGANDIIAGTGMEVRQDGEPLWGSFTLTIKFPNNGVVVVDGKNYSGSIQLNVSSGLHSLSIEPIISFENGSRLRFDHWSDNSLAMNRTLRVNSDVSLEAVYVSQYELRIESQYPVTGSGWYDAGSIANFTTSATPSFTNNSLGLWSFSGWYDQNGILITTLRNGSVVMNSSRVLEARWHADYTLPYIAVAIAVGLTVTLIVVYRCRKRARGQ